MSDQNQTLNCREGAAPLDRAGLMAKKILQHVKSTKGDYYEHEFEFIREAAKFCGLSPSAFRGLVYVSRQPKIFAVYTWERIRGGYLRLLRHQLAALQAEIEAVEALDATDRALEDLLHKAKSLVREIEAAAGREA